MPILNNFVLPSGESVPPKLQSKNVTENGAVYPDDGYDALSSVVVDVQPKLQSLKVTENGEHYPDDGFDGFSHIVVDMEPMIDVSSSTVTSDALLEGITAYDTNGNIVVGTGVIAHNGVIPAGGIYTTVDNTIYTEGDDFPDIVNDGDLYVYGDYEYKYNYHYIPTMRWFSNKDSSGNHPIHDGWGVRVLDDMKASYGQFVSQINKKPLTNASLLFYNNTSLKSAANISFPSTLKDIGSIFWGCSSMTSAPVIPSSVCFISGAFCGCSSLTGEIQINCDSSCGLYAAGNEFKDTVKPIKITGSCPENFKEYLAATANNGNVTYDIVDAGDDEGGSSEGGNTGPDDDFEDDWDTPEQPGNGSGENVGPWDEWE